MRVGVEARIAALLHFELTWLVTQQQVKQDSQDRVACVCVRVCILDVLHSLKDTWASGAPCLQTHT